LDKETVALISKMNVGDISPATAYTSEEKKAAVRIVFLKSRTEPHILNLRDDYNRIASEALEQKKAEVIDKWMATKIPTYYIMVDKTSSESCESLQKYNSTDSRGF